MTVGQQDNTIKLGVSSCLLGENVRYDGESVRNSLIADDLGPYAKFIPICPETEIGLPTPRPPAHLVHENNRLHFREIGSGRDHTADLLDLAERRVAELRKEKISGFIFKSKSPSCGLYWLEVRENGKVTGVTGRGIFARVITERMRGLPVEEERRLKDPRLFENFLERVFAYNRMNRLFDGQWDINALAEFHAKESLLLMAHDPEANNYLGMMIGEAFDWPKHQAANEYRRGFMAALTKPADRLAHKDVLEHVAGFVESRVNQTEADVVKTVIAGYEKGEVGRSVPLGALEELLLRHKMTFLADQSYFKPFPLPLMSDQRL